MQRAFELAALGRGSVSPNPMVGCVIVHEGKIIGEGWHQKYGEPHAEVNAINAVENENWLKESTVYVTLEPCAHHGKTPPCADLLVYHQVKKVVIGAFDSNPLVGGQGIARLESAGIEVKAKVLEEQARRINVRFFTSIEQKRPYVILKWAQTSDGFVARKNYDSKWISNSESRQLVHQWRTEEDAILVGPNTAKYDNPRLNVRGLEGKDPTRILIDRNLTVSNDFNLFDGSQSTLVYNTLKKEKGRKVEWIQLNEGNFISELLKDLHARKIHSVIIEGGSEILNAFISGGLWDEARVFTSQTTFGEGIAAPVLSGKKISQTDVVGDSLVYFANSQ